MLAKRGRHEVRQRCRRVDDFGDHAKAAATETALEVKGEDMSEEFGPCDAFLG